MDEGEATEEDESAETQRRATKRSVDRHMPLCKELSDLICPFLQSSQLKDLQTVNESRMFSISIFSQFIFVWLQSQRGSISAVLTRAIVFELLTPTLPSSRPSPSNFSRASIPTPSVSTLRI